MSIRKDPMLGDFTNLFADFWRGEIELDGKTEITVEPGDDLTFARARRVVEKLRAPGVLARVKQQLATQVWDPYIEYCHELREGPLSSPEELAGALRVDTLAIKGTVATLWFGRVLGEHSVLGVLSDDCERVELDQP